METFQPTATWLKERTTGERLYLGTKWASLIPYEKVADLRKEVLPVSASTHHKTVCQIFERQPDAMKPELDPELPMSDGPMTVGLDGGYVRGAHRECDWALMKLQGMRENQKAFRQQRPEIAAAISKQPDSAKHLLCHSNIEEAFEPLNNGSEPRSDSGSRPTAQAAGGGCDGIRNLYSNNQESIPNYGDGYRQGRHQHVRRIDH